MQAYVDDVGDGLVNRCEEVREDDQTKQQEGYDQIVVVSQDDEQGYREKLSWIRSYFLGDLPIRRRNL
jgi:hypothetical protein